MAEENSLFENAPDEIKRENTEQCPVYFDPCGGYFYDEIFKAARKAKIELLIIASDLPKSLTDSIDELIEKITLDHVEEEYETAESFDFELSGQDLESINFSFILGAQRKYFKQFAAILKPYGFELEEHLSLFY